MRRHGQALADADLVDSRNCGLPNHVGGLSVFHDWNIHPGFHISRHLFIIFRLKKNDQNRFKGMNPICTLTRIN